MSFHKYLWCVLIASIGGLAAGCSAQQAANLPAIVASSSQSDSSKAPLHHKKRVKRLTPPTTVYVGDDTLNEILEYPFGVENPSPKGSISLPAGPRGIAEDEYGNLYVSMYNQDNIDIFNSEGLLTGQLSIGCPSVHGLWIDPEQNLYVANQCHGPGTVAEYALTAGGSPQLEHTYQTEEEAAFGVTTDSNDNVYIAGAGPEGDYNFFEEFAQQGSMLATKYMSGADQAIGIGIWEDDVAVGGANYLTTFAPPYFNQVNQTDYGPGFEVDQLTVASDGTMYVPVYGTGAPGVVHVYPSSPVLPYTISQDLIQPWCVTTGL